MKRILAIILTAVMMGICIAVPASADEIGTVSSENASEYRTLKFNITIQGGGATPKYIEIKPGDENIILPILEDTNELEFVGWAVSEDANVRYWKNFKYNYDSFKDLGYVDGVYTLYAYWKPKDQGYTVTVLAEPETGGTVDGNGVYESSERVSIAAKPSEGYLFAGFYEDEKKVSDGEYDEDYKEYVYGFDVNENHVFVAKFIKIMPIKFKEAAAITDGSGIGTLRFIFEAEDGETPDSFGAYLSSVGSDDKANKLEYKGKPIKTGETYSVDVTEIESGDLLSAYYAIPYVKYGDKEIVYDHHSTNASDVMLK